MLGWRGRGGEVARRRRRGRGDRRASRSARAIRPALLAEAAGVPAGDELILRRTAGADGRRQAWANDRRVTAETLRALADTLVELHGQHDDRGLLDARGHRALLDAFAGAEAELGRGARGLGGPRRRRPARSTPPARRWRPRRATATSSRTPPPSSTRSTRSRTRSRRSTPAAASSAPPSASARTSRAPPRRSARRAPRARCCRRCAGWRPRRRGRGRRSTPALDGLGRVLAELGEVSRAVERLLADLDGDPGELERVEERLFALRGLARKHQVAPEALPALADDAARPPARARGRRGRHRRPRGGLAAAEAALRCRRRAALRRPAGRGGAARRAAWRGS